MNALPLTVNALCKKEMKYHSKFGHTYGKIQIKIDIFYTAFCLGTKTMSPILPYLQGLNNCIQYLAIHPHKPIFILITFMIDQTSSDLHRVGIKLKTTLPRIFENVTKKRNMQ